jgi:hypothetical protein
LHLDESSPKFPRIGELRMGDRGGDHFKHYQVKRLQEIDREIARLAAVLERIDEAIARPRLIDGPLLPPKVCA